MFESLALPSRALRGYRFRPTKRSAVGINAPAPRPPFTDYRFEKPGTIRKITLEDLARPARNDIGRQ